MISGTFAANTERPDAAAQFIQIHWAVDKTQAQTVCGAVPHP